MAGSDPVIFFESQRLYDIGELFEKEVPAEYYEVPFGPPAQRRVGKDVTIITVGATMYRALEAADILEQKYGITCDVFDCRSISPLDYDPLVASVRKTGRFFFLPMHVKEALSCMTLHPRSVSSLLMTWTHLP